MPTYRYECNKCEEIHEIFHSISEPPRKKCPDCGGKLERLIGAGGFVPMPAGFGSSVASVMLIAEPLGLDTNPLRQNGLI